MSLDHIPLDQIVYILEDGLYGDAWCSGLDLIEVDDASRAKYLQDKGRAFIVSDAHRWAQFYKDEQAEGRDWPELANFLQRVKSFPLDWRSAEWETLVKDLWVPFDPFAEKVMDYWGREEGHPDFGESPEDKPARRRKKRKAEEASAE